MRCCKIKHIKCASTIVLIKTIVIWDPINRHFNIYVRAHVFLIYVFYLTTTHSKYVLNVKDLNDGRKLTETSSPNNIALCE